jgi:hypothetical protein
MTCVREEVEGSRAETDQLGARLAFAANERTLPNDPLPMTLSKSKSSIDMASFCEAIPRREEGGQRIIIAEPSLAPTTHSSGLERDLNVELSSASRGREPLIGVGVLVESGGESLKEGEAEVSSRELEGHRTSVDSLDAAEEEIVAHVVAVGAGDDGGGAEVRRDGDVRNTRHIADRGEKFMARRGWDLEVDGDRAWRKAREGESEGAISLRSQSDVSRAKGRTSEP